MALRPLDDDPVAALEGKYEHLGINTDEMRAEARREEDEAEQRRMAPTASRR